MAGTENELFPPCLEDPTVKQELDFLRIALATELPGTMVAVVWGRCEWQKSIGHDSEGVPIHSEDKLVGTRRPFVTIDKKPAKDHSDTFHQDRIGTNGTYWVRHNEMIPPQDGFRSILDIAPRSAEHTTRLATAMQTHYQLTNLGNGLIVVPPDDRTDITGISWGFQT